MYQSGVTQTRVCTAPCLKLQGVSSGKPNAQMQSAEPEAIQQNKTTYNADHSSIA